MADVCSLIFDGQLMVASEQMKDRGLLKSEQVKKDFQQADRELLSDDGSIPLRML